MHAGPWLHLTLRVEIWAEIGHNPEVAVSLRLADTAASRLLAPSWSEDCVHLSCNDAPFSNATVIVTSEQIEAVVAIDQALRQCIANKALHLLILDQIVATYPWVFVIWVADCRKCRPFSICDKACNADTAIHDWNGLAKFHTFCFPYAHSATTVSCQQHAFVWRELQLKNRQHRIFTWRSSITARLLEALKTPASNVAISFIIIPRRVQKLTLWNCQVRNCKTTEWSCLVMSNVWRQTISHSVRNRRQLDQVRCPPKTNFANVTGHQCLFVVCEKQAIDTHSLK